MIINHQLFERLKKIEREQIDLNFVIRASHTCYDKLKKRLDVLESKCYETGLFIRYLEDQEIEEWNEILKPTEI